jgi:hypothetical protein
LGGGLRRERIHNSSAEAEGHSGRYDGEGCELPFSGLRAP